MLVIQALFIGSWASMRRSPIMYMVAMSADDVSMSVEEVTAEAESALRQADPLCVEANSFLIECKKLNENSTALWARTLFLHDAQAAQLQNMGNLYVILKHSIEQARLESEKRIEQFRRERSELSTLLQALRLQHVDPTLGSGTLHGYVHTEDLDALDRQVNASLEVLSNGLSSLTQVPEQLQRELSAFRDRQPQLSDSCRNAPRDMASEVEGIAPLARDLADDLDSLGRHFDLCMQLPTLDVKDRRDALSVIESDRPQVREAVKRVREGHARILELKKSADERHRLLLEMFASVRDAWEAVDIFTSHSLRERVAAIQARHHEASATFSSANDLIAELEGLVEYYRLYSKAYHALVVELARRRQSQQHLRKIVEEANAALAMAHQKEASTRQDFIDAYGDYLPPDLWTPDSGPRTYAIEFIPEDIPEPSKDTLARALKELR